MPITLPIATLIAGAAGTGASIIGSHQASSANQDAASAQEKYNEEALAAAKQQQDIANQQWQKQFDYQRQQDDLNRQMALERQGYQRGQYSQYLNRLSPYATAPQQSLPILNQLLQPSQIGMGSAPSSGGVLMRAPDGSTQMVDPAHVAHYTSAGAQLVNG
jgi:hypothetical protein